MTKTENRAAAKAYQTEQEHKRRQDAHADAVKADLEQLEILRHYLVFHARSGVVIKPLVDAIDDHVEKLTGDRTSLHAKSSSIG